jgi:outer membrane protein
MKLTNKVALTAAVALGSIQAANASFGLGAGVGVSTELYRDYDRTILPIPLINYDSDNFYFRGLGGGYHLFKDAKDQLSLNAYYMPLEFKPGDTDYQPMKQLDKRKSSIMAGIVYRHTEQWGIIRTSLSADVLGHSDGILGDVAYLYPLEFNRITLSAGAGVTWASKQYNKYYFGVSGNESARSGLATYKPSDSWSPYLEMNVHHQIDANWSVNMNGRVTKLPDEVKDSPMIDTNYNSVLFVGMNYMF